MGLGILIVGDGMGEVIGKSIKSIVLTTPWGRNKTLAGCIAVFVFGSLGSMILCYLVFGMCFVKLSLIAGLFGSVTEFYSPPNYDNVFIPLSSIVVGFLFY
ncbi:Phosphatidate cytidylyltransferase [Entamoeba marina]